MIDVHAHFAEEGYSFPGEWEKIKGAGVDTVILAGDNLAHSLLHRDFCKTHAGAYFCAGVHPSETGGFGKETAAALKALASDRKCVAIGETGLDYHYEDTDRAAQRRAFEEQLALAFEAGLPVQVHSRDACADTLAVLKNAAALLKHGLLLHCYSYGRENMEEFLKLGAYFSFGGVVCFKNARRVWESVEDCPKDRLLTETDSPYLSPFRGEKNTPANIPVILQRIAEIKGMEQGELEAIVKDNALRLFPKLL